MRQVIRRIVASETLLGTVVVATAVVALGATTLFYTHPVGQRTVAFETTDAAALSTGQEVRVAGITVGKVTKVSFRPDTVLVEAQVSDDTFIGDDSHVEVRMLTPVGGYAVTVVPLGRTPLGSRVIPVDHVTVPYSIGDVLQAAPHVTDKVDGATVDANIDQVAQALQHNSTSVGSLISGMNSIAAVMDRQRSQIEQITGLASEYLKSFDTNRDFVFDLIRQIDIVVSTYNNAHVGFNEAYSLLGDVLMRVQPEMKFYLDHKDQVRAVVDQVKKSIESLDTTMGPAIDKLQGLRAQLEAWLTPQGLATVSGGTILASNVCIPLPGRTC
ncbi:MlaD family protein [Nocardia cerradoensis]|uniref:MlaD family protein n=1 Tax=Nocardia cerradoensis TaxID=85688 RepID=UPI00031A4BB7|nr:MlaD family protein [Nocardia cerradoensis]NKY48417.1 MCE family protein [Nocardia cerradoensis]